MVLEQVLDDLLVLPEDEQKAVVRDALKATQGMLWVPNPGSQLEAYESEADEIGFGGEAGPGKTDLAIGLALTQHRRSLVLRRTNKEAGKLNDRITDIMGSRQGLNEQKGWRIGNKMIEVGGCEHEDDKQKYKGHPRDLIAFDEVVDFTESIYTFIIQWNRSTDPGQRCRVVATFNPPTKPVGLWVIRRWGPWLDPHHPNPADSGEIRWFTTINGMDTEVDGPGPHIVDGEKVMAKSRTFIRGYLHENPDLERTGYDATRAAAPKELREAYRAGNFEAALRDVPNQVIPTAWIRAAQERWKPRPTTGIPMCAIGVDCSGGGDDPMILAIRHDGWYAPMIEVPGKDIPQERAGAHCAGIIVSHRRDNALVVVDLGGGYGGPIFERLHENEIECEGFKGAEKTTRRTRDKRLAFRNKRSAAIWAFREALDPGQAGGSCIMLPPEDRLLVADLTAPIFEVGSGGIEVESKESVCERLGRSTDRGDAVMMCWWTGPKAITAMLDWLGRSPNEMGQPYRKRPVVIMDTRLGRVRR